MNELIINEISDRLSEIGKSIGFSNLIIRSDKYVTEIYVLKKHALQLEIDWQENNLYMYVVYLKNKKIPNKNVIYNYEDGHWCRKFVEEIYKTKRPYIKDCDRRYSSEYLFECFEFYVQLISRNLMVLVDFYKSINDEG